MNGESRTGRVAVVGGYGVASIQKLIAALPDRPNVALLAVIPDEPKLALALRPHTKLMILEAQPRLKIESNRIYIVPAGKDVVFLQGELMITPATTPGVQIDRLIRSVSDELGRDAIGVILRGPGTDGSVGIKRVKEAGGLAFAEDPGEGSFGEMPRSAIATGSIDLCGDPAALAAAITRVGAEETLSPLADDDDKRGGEDVTDTLRDILTLVRVRSGNDFSAYKRATLYRRVARRMQVCQTAMIGDYHQYLRDHPGELAHLLRDFLISVTNFFRDPDAFDALAREVLPKLFDQRGASEQLRVWVPGCATGEEAYSLGILLLEHASKLGNAPQLQIFATDIDEESLTDARAGRYPDTIAVDVSPERLEQFFVREANEYRVSQELRELVLFSPHNVLRDPPFSRLDLVSCRNMLIYLNREAQNRVLSMFHFGLRPDGFLFLGSSESAEATQLFSTVDPKTRIFSRRMAPASHGLESLVTAGRWYPPPVTSAPAPVERTTSLGETHHRLVELYAPPSILVNGDLDVLHISEHAGAYLQLAGGEPTRDILRLIHPALRLDLRTAIYAARQSEERVESRRVVFDEGGERRSIELRVRALDIQELGPNSVLLYLDEGEGTGETLTRGDGAIEPVVREMENELHRTRDQLRNTIEQYETSLEELKASNEELQAINEELRSASEELETSKEELQSVNEELTTLNHELKAKIDEVSHANSDLQNLMTSTDIGVVFLDRALNIKRFTPRALDVFNMIPGDIGRPIAHLTHKLETTELADLARTVLHDLRTIERDVPSTDGRLYLVRLLPYRSLEDRIDGVVLTFVDVSDQREAVDARQRSEAALQTTEARLGIALRNAPVVVLGLDSSLHITWGYVLGREVAPGSLASQDLFTAASSEMLSQMIAETTLTKVGRRGELELTVGGFVRTYDMRIEPAGKEVTAVGFDVTSSNEGQAALRDADRRKDEFLATLSHELRNPLTPLKMALDIAKLARDKPAQLEQSHQIMERQVHIIEELVDDLLDLARITQGKIELACAPLDPSVVVEAALEATQPLLRDQRHKLTIELPPAGTQILGDQMRLTQVLTNLVTNAAKYTPPGGRISVSVTRDEARKLLSIRVEDNGVGIEADMLARVFEIFVQCRDDAGRSRGGLGIGLNLVKRLVELHGGKVSAASDGAGKGSAFTVELPMLERRT